MTPHRDRSGRERWIGIVAEIGSECAGAGLDLAQPFRVDRYNDAVEAEYGLPDFGRRDALGVLIGSSRALWLRFLAALRARPDLLEDPDPLDRYVSERVGEALGRLPVRHEIRFAQEPPPRRVAIQRLAHVAGLAWLSPSHLNVHPVFGPWIALRAVAVIDVAGPGGPAPALASPCTRCDLDCEPAFRCAVDAAGASPTSHDVVGPHWRAWLAVRDACPVGREHRYGEDEIVYHYTRDRAALLRAVASR